ncbi:MAG: hypothetical protein IKU40_09405 [Clostridia bacterium]|nr:hypothetical protein [Clostridia bacterium]
MTDPSHPVSKKSMSRKLFFVYVLLTALLLTILCGSFTATVIRSVDNILARLAEDDRSLSTFVTVFSALDSAVLEVHSLIPGLLAFIFSLGVGMIVRIGRKKGGVRFAVCLILAVIAGILLFIVSLAVSILLTEVNDIRFADLLLSLYHNLEGLATLL